MGQVHAIALIAEGGSEPGSTGWGCRRALEGRFAVEVVPPGRSPGSPADLVLVLGDPPAHDVPAPGARVAWWSVGSGRSVEAIRRHAERFDYVFAPDRSVVDEARCLGLDHCWWLPEATDPEFHRKSGVAKLRDVALIGGPGPVHDELAERIRADHPDLATEASGLLDPSTIDATSRVVVHLGLGGGSAGRLFEALARGATVLMRCPGDEAPDARFQSGIHLDTFRDADDLARRIEHCLRDPGHARRLAALGRREVLANHTYAARLRELLEIVSYRPGRDACPPADAPIGTEAFARPVAG